MVLGFPETGLLDIASRGRRLWLAALWIAAAGGFAAAQNPTTLPPPPPKEGDDFKISAEVQLVALDVSVRDKDGGFVSGLEKDSFKVYENGKPQTISQFSNADQPVSVGLIVDSSGSMRPKRGDVITGALAFIGASNPADEIFVINFNDKVRRGLPDAVPFTDDVSKLRAALWMGEPAGRTALYDAILEGLHQLDMGRQSKKTLIVVSDGGDNISQHNFKDVMAAVLDSRATIYTIGVFDDEDPDKNPEVLRKLAGVSGGVAYFPHRPSEVMDICRQIAKDVRSRYSLAYIPQDTAHSGVRHIKVEAVSPDRGKLMARTRSSYTIADGNAVTTADRRKK